MQVAGEPWRIHRLRELGSNESHLCWSSRMLHFVQQAGFWMISMAIWSATNRGLRRPFGRMDRRLLPIMRFGRTDGETT